QGEMQRRPVIVTASPRSGPAQPEPGGGMRQRARTAQGEIKPRSVILPVSLKTLFGKTGRKPAATCRNQGHSIGGL
ncbi:MAG: hypothetical protein WCP99_17445, partial [Burkholderiales bacterium]